MIYEYQCECGEVIERDYPMTQMKKKVRCACGKMAPRKFAVTNAIVRHRLGDPRIGRGKGIGRKQWK